MPTLVCTIREHFYSYEDENNLFSWFKKIDEYIEVVRTDAGLEINLGENLISKEGMYELCSIYKRYGGNMLDLEPLVHEGIEEWFRNPEAYWNQWRTSVDT